MIPNPVDGIGEISVDEFNNFHRHRQVKQLFILLCVLLVFIPGALFIASKTGFNVPFLSKAKEFKLVESSPSNFQNSFSPIGQPTFVFSKKLSVSEKDLPQYFRISPQVPGSWHIEENKQVVYFSSDKKQATTFAQVLQPNTVYTITIAKALQSGFETLKENPKITFRTERDTSAILRANKKLMHALPDTPISVDMFTVSDKNLASPSLHVTVQTATVSQLITYLAYKNPGLPVYQFTPTSETKTIREIDTILLPPKTEYGPSNIQLPGIHNPGLYFVSVKNKTENDDFFVVVSNHIHHTHADNNSLSVVTAQAQKGTVIPDVTITVYDLQKGIAVTTTTTNTQGIAKLERKEGLDLIVTTKENDIAISQVGYYGLSGDNSLISYQVFAYTDKSIYQPGETVHYKAVVRQATETSYSIPTGTLYVRLRTRYTDESKDYKAATLDKNGTLVANFQLPQSVVGISPEIILASKRDDDYITLDTQGLHVETYRKPDIEISVTTDTEYISQDTAKATLSAKTLYGKPLTNTDFTYRVVVNNYDEIKDRTDESITPSNYYGSGNALTQGNGRFDEKGNATISFSTNLSGFKKSQIATIEVTPQIGASPSIGKTAMLIHRGDYAIFFDDVKAASTSGITGTIQTLNHKNPRQALPNQKVSLLLTKILTEGRKEIKSQEVTTDANGNITFSFTTIDSGSYEIKATGKDERNNTITTIYPLTVGNYTYTNTQAKPQTFEAKQDKTIYNPGETATITVTASFPVSDAQVLRAMSFGNGYWSGSAKITSFITQSINKSSWTITIPLGIEQVQPESLIFYTVYQGILYDTQADLAISPEKKRINVQVQFDKPSVKPGQTITATITTKDSNGQPISADTSLGVIDNAVLQVDQYNRDIFSRFYHDADRFYGVNITSSDSTQGILAEYGGGGGGGGGGDALRSQFVDTAYWNGHIQTNEEGKASVQFTAPDNLTTFTGFAFANTATQFGQAKETVVVEKDIAIIPAVPALLYQDDKPELSAVIHNALSIDVQAIASLTIKESNLTENVPITITKGAYEHISFPVSLPKLGLISITFTVKNTSGKTLDAVTLQKNILPKGAITSSWESFEGSHNVSFAPPYPDSDTNSMNVQVVPHIAQQINDKDFYLTTDVSTRLGQSLFAVTSIMQATQQGSVDPQLYKYAKLRNDFRQSMNTLLQKMTQDRFLVNVKSDNNGGSLFEANAWFFQGMKQAETNHQLEDITNRELIIKTLSSFLKSYAAVRTVNPSQTVSLNKLPANGTTPTYLTKNDVILLDWVLEDESKSAQYRDDIQLLAVRALKGESYALSTLKKKVLPSASDRYVWTDDNELTQTLATLAVVEKGSALDAQKAVKGLTVAKGDSYNASDLDLSIGIKQALRDGRKITDTTTFTVLANDEKIFSSKDQNYQSNYFTSTFSPKNSNGTATVSIETTGPLPVYTTATKTQYTTSNKANFFSFFSFGKTTEKRIPTQITRSYIDFTTYQPILNLKNGQTAVVVLQFPNPFPLLPYTIDTYPSSVFALSVTDSISPAMMYLDQTSGNSTQDSGRIETLMQYLNNPSNPITPTPPYPIPTGGIETFIESPPYSPPSYMLPSLYSDQAVFFTGLPPKFSQSDTITLPYVAYQITNGSYYQPPTSIVFPSLGVILTPQE